MTVRATIGRVFSRLDRTLHRARCTVDRYLPAAPLGVTVPVPGEAAAPGAWTVVREEHAGVYRVVARCTTAALADIILADAPLDNTYASVPPAWTPPR